MNRNLIFALVFALAVLLVGCSGTVPPVTAEPTAVIPTEVPPTAVPSPTPATKPTVVPTEVPTPTEIPLYVSLSAEEVRVLRAQCLQENSDSLCLPLPVDPTLPGLMLVEDHGAGYTSLTLTGTDGVTLVSPLDGSVNYERNGDGPGDLRFDRTFYLGFRWSSGLEVSIFRPDPQRPRFALPIADAEIAIFGGEELRQESGSGTSVVGGIVVTIEGSFQLSINAGMGDLLRTEAGSRVYVLSLVPTPEVTSPVLEPWEALDLIMQDCQPMEGLTSSNVGSYLDAIADYADELLSFVLEPGPERDRFQAIPFFTEGKGCAIAISNPGEELGLLIPNSVLIYETVTGEIRVIYTNRESTLPGPS